MFGDSGNRVVAALKWNILVPRGQNAPTAVAIRYAR
jgi:hypothetical protein